MKTEQTLSPEDSLHIINSMIDQARFNFSKNSVFFILWGILLIAASLFELYGKSNGLFYHWAGWPIAGILGGIGSTIYGNRKEKQQGHVPNLERLYNQIWQVYLITLAMLIPALVFNHVTPNGYIMLLTAFPTVLTGSVLKFRPLVWGGATFWVCGLITLFVLPEMDNLLFAISLVTGYIIPGIMMKKVTA